MKISLPRALWVVLLTAWATLPLSINAAPDDDDFDPEDEIVEDPSEAVVVEEEEPRAWFFNFGTTTRSVNAAFHLDGRQTTLNWRRYINQKSGRGDVGLYRGGSRPVHYNNGFVGPHNIPRYNNFGGGGGYVTSPNQLAYAPNRSPLERNQIVSFQSEDFRYSSTFNPYSVNVSDSDVGVGPYLQFGYHLASVETCIINFVTGGSYISTDHGSGNRMVASLSVMENHTEYTYQYDHVSNPGLPNPLPGTVFGPNQYFVANPNATTTNGITVIPPLSSRGYLPPRQSDNSSNRTVARFYAMSQSNLDVNLNEIPFGIEIGRRVGPVDLFFTAGSTVNIIDYNLSNSVSWYQQGSNSPISTQRWRDSGTPVRVGFYSGLAIKVPLNSGRKIFFEAHGTYRWVDPVHASAGIADVTIDPSSWESGIGFLIFLD